MIIFATILALMAILIGGGIWEARNCQKTKLPESPEREGKDEDERVTHLGRS